MSLEKKIHSPQDLHAWTMSVAHREIMTMIQNVSRHITSKPVKKDIPVSNGIRSLCDLLEYVEKRTDCYPPEVQPQRFGNAAFRSWSAWLFENAHELCKSMLFDKNNVTSSTVPGMTVNDLIDETSGYFCESFGNATRIDYGTGHELAFVAFLVCLFKGGVLQAPILANTTPTDDYMAVGLVIMPKYLQLVRKLQVLYRMEPAGSHGVWCLDDYQFVPFIWGSSQLIGNDLYSPITISDRQIAAEAKDQYLLFSCVDYIFQVKSGPFEEHSPTLCGIAQVPFWEKVHSGLIKMYKGEVLNKFPVVQHFMFGRLLPFDRSQTPQSGPRLNVSGSTEHDQRVMQPPRIPNVPRAAVAPKSSTAADSENTAVIAPRESNAIP